MVSQTLASKAFVTIACTCKAFPILQQGARVAFAILGGDGSAWVASSVDSPASSVDYFLLTIDNALPTQGGFVGSVGQLVHNLLPDVRR